MSSIYKAVILNHYRHPQNYGRLEHADRSVKANNPLCVDQIILDVKFKHNRIENIRFTAQGCAISIAAASILSQAVKGKTRKEILILNKDFILKKLGIPLSPNRLKCALLPLEAIQKAIK